MVAMARTVPATRTARSGQMLSNVGYVALIVEPGAVHSYEIHNEPIQCQVPVAYRPAQPS